MKKTFSIEYAANKNFGEQKMTVSFVATNSARPQEVYDGTFTIDGSDVDELSFEPFLRKAIEDTRVEA